MLTTDLLQGAGVAVIAVLTATSALELWHLAALAAIVGAANAFYLPTITAILPQLVPRDDLVDANALRSGSQLLAQSLIGPALGGLLVAAVGSGAAFALDAGSFGVSFLALLAIRARARPEVSQQKLRRDLAEGLAYTKSQPWLWVSLVAVAFANLFFSGSIAILIPLLVKNELGGGPASSAHTSPLSASAARSGSC